MDSTLFAFIIGVLIVGILLIAIIALSRKGTSQLDVTKYRMKWLAIEQQLGRNDVASHQLCILNADKLLDQALQERGTKGETMGARMKTLQTTWTNANSVWGAHKLRNRIAHESDIHISYDDARRALGGFKQALKDLGAI